ncbi:hypothetical protein CHL67_09080 [Prosthecochloris sp. GSB1]|nr:hypothetical protein CHL67_09080 [Prosthecochloris sp. GSB1]
MFTGSGLVVCEKRIPGTADTAYACYREEDGGTVLDHFTLETFAPGKAEGFGMTGLETVDGKLFYIHAFQPDSPEHLGLWAIDPLREALAWARPDCAFVAHVEEGMLVYRAGSFAGFPERYYLLLDPSCGGVVSEPGQDTSRVARLRAGAFCEEARQGVLLPSPDGGGASRPGEMREHIRRGELLVTVDHVPVRREKGFEARIRVRRNGVAVYEDVLSRNTPVPCVNYFLLHGVRLYYIRNMTELVSVGVQH